MIVSLIIPMVPSMGTVEAAGSYTIRVNKGTNVVTVYQNGSPIKAFICSVGNATPTGTFNTSQKLNWHELQGQVYGQYCTRITGSILFHSVWYFQRYNKASQSHDAYNKLGTTASAGCVRLTVADAKWIYDNCPLGTSVTIFYGSSGNDPLGKPSAMKVNSGTKMGWDPTDPDPANPYKAANPTISYVGSREVSVHSSFDPRAGVVAKDSAGNNISSRVTVSGNVDTSRLGSYNLQFHVTDTLGRSASTSATINVVDYNKPTITGVMDNKEVQYNTKLNVRKNVTARSYAGQDLTSALEIYIKLPGEKSKKFTKSELTFKKLGTYKVVYKVKNPQNGKSARKEVSIKVIDTKVPKLINVGKNRTVEFGTKIKLKTGVKAYAATGTNLTKQIKTYVKKPGAKKAVLFSKTTYPFRKLGKYTIEYKVTNPQNKKSVSKTQTITVKDTKKPKLSNMIKNQKVEYGASIDIATSVKATAATGVNLKSKLIVSVKQPGSTAYKKYSKKIYKFSKLGKYTIRYKVKNPQNKKEITATRTITVVDTKKPVLSGIMTSPITKEHNTKLDLMQSISAKSAANEDLTSNIVVSMKKPSQTAATVLSERIVTLDEVGEYTVTYTVTNPKNNKKVSQTIKITVVDNSAPVIEGAADKTASVLDSINVLEGITAKTQSSGIDLTDKITVSVKFEDNSEVTVTDGRITVEKAGTYTVEYTVEYNEKTTTEQCIITVN